MDNLARPEQVAGFGGGFVRSILSDGSMAIVTPLLTYLGDGSERPDLRSSAKVARGALMADIAHFINISHGRHPGVIDHAASKIVDDAARTWLIQAADGFAAERRYLNALTVAAGPIRRHIGQDKVTAMITGQNKNFEMLATSDRNGCPAGCAIAFVTDWSQSRVLLDRAALILGMQPAPNALPTQQDCTHLADAIATNDATRRAMAFGAQQLLGQQRGLWQMIAARHHELVAG
jgi:hypothetical protein